MDFYSYTTAHGTDTFDKVSISLTNNSTDLRLHLELYDDQGSKLDGYTADTAGQNLTYTIACPGGTYIYRVSGWNTVMTVDNGSSGTYPAIVENLDVNDDQVPNHTCDTAFEASFGTEYNGVIVSIYENDWFQVTNTDTDRWETFTVTLTEVSDTLARNVAIYDDRQTELYHNDGAVLVIDKGSDFTHTVATKSSGLYFWVYGWDNIMHNTNGSTGTYTFQVTDNNANDSKEPDDTSDDARVINTFPTTDLTGTILVDAANDNGGDYEWFVVSIAAGKRIEWSFDPEVTNTEMHFNVYDSSLGSLGSYDGSDGETVTGGLNNNSGADTTFYIKLGAFVGDNGNYTAAFTETDAP